MKGIDVSIQISGTVQSGVFGTYTIRYNATDSSGNVADEVTRTVSVSIDATPPVLTLVDENKIQTIECVIDTYDNHI